MSGQDQIAAAVQELTLATERMRAGLAEFHNGTRLRGARYISVESGGGRLDRDGLIWGGPGRLLGWSLASSDAESYLWLRDSRMTSSGELIARIHLVQDQGFQTAWFGPGGVSFGDGLYLQEEDGHVYGAFYIGAVD